MVSAGGPRGSTLLRELGDELPLGRLEAILRGFGPLAGDDRSSIRLRRVTGGGLDLSVGAHRTALLAWLRAWGCRHLRVADTGRSSRALAGWWRVHRASLPDPARPLVAMADRELELGAAAFDALATAPAAWRSLPDGRASVSFGQTAAAKALFAIRPLAFPPWDEPIRATLGLEDRAGRGYRTYLDQVADALRRLSSRLGVPVASLPDVLGRPGSSPPKLVDEYLWMRVRRPAKP
jgi:hypothetical protein